MQSKFSILKNMIWSLAIVVSLAALFIGLILGTFKKYPGEQQDGILYLGNRPAGSAPADDSSADFSSGEAEDDISPADGQLNLLPETEDGGEAYIDSLTFLCDTSLMGLKNYELLKGGHQTEQFWGTEAGNMPANSIASANIVNPSDGVIMPPAMAAGINQPQILVISIGMDGLASANAQQFISDYTNLINSIKEQSPSTRIILCSPTSVINSYDGIDSTTVALCNELKGWIETVCKSTGVYYADIAKAVCDPSGTLLNEYASTNGKTITSSGLEKILMYLRTHKL